MCARCHVVGQVGPASVRSQREGLPVDERISSSVLVQLSGVPGSGKSRLATSIAEATGFVVVDTDVLKSSIVGSGVPVAAAGPVTYGAALALAQDLLEQGRTVVLDSPCRYQQLLDSGRRKAGAHGVRYAFIELWVRDWSGRAGSPRRTVPQSFAGGIGNSPRSGN
ncbi:AAA family ATPase [Nocardioides sp. GCM10028917]|uniref:AAA family ATPase n=1 Tax=Nocardioides sp. GCM10028917 TaxID=3273408 RepID=UPI00361B5286